MRKKTVSCECGDKLPVHLASVAGLECRHVCLCGRCYGLVGGVIVCIGKEPSPQNMLSYTSLLKELDRLRSDCDRATRKWREYERAYILPMFKYAKSGGIDLSKLVKENPGQNCVELLFAELRRKGLYRDEYVPESSSIALTPGKAALRIAAGWLAIKLCTHGAVEEALKDFMESEQYPLWKNLSTQDVYGALQILLRDMIMKPVRDW